MSQAGSTAKKRQISFWTAISAAHEGVFGSFRQFAGLAAIPFALSLAIGVLKIPSGLFIPASDLIFIALDLLPFAILGVALNRALLGEEALGLLSHRLLGRRTFSYLGYTLLMLLVVVIPIILLVLVSSGISAAGYGSGLGTSLGNGFLLLGIALFLLALYVVARLSLVFPALSIDRRLGLAGSWRLSRGVGLKLLGVILAVLFFMVLTGIVGGLVLRSDININIGGTVEIIPGASVMDTILASLPSLTWSIVVSYAGCGLIVAAYASAYTQLSGWGGPREEILERFE
ncbi:hypothetical protein AAFN88_02170 [Pelagibius sp. CAU 1746]|uniref:hypothetical protein n=1 Tax=Pelagibius sp. CAU 1746 TaxID=3140370 RepID=UPI00325B2AE8